MLALAAWEPKITQKTNMEKQFFVNCGTSKSKFQSAPLSWAEFDERTNQGTAPYTS